MSDHITVTTTPERIDADCSICQQGTNVPNKGIGRAMIAVWKTQHQHLESA